MSDADRELVLLHLKLDAIMRKLEVTEDDVNPKGRFSVVMDGEWIAFTSDNQLDCERWLQLLQEEYRRRFRIIRG